MAEASSAHIRGAGVDVPGILDGLKGEATESVLSTVRDMIYDITRLAAPVILATQRTLF